MPMPANHAVWCIDLHLATLRYGYDPTLPGGVWADIHGPEPRLDYDHRQSCYDHDRPLEGLVTWLVGAEMGFTAADMAQALTWVSDVEEQYLYDGLSAPVAIIVRMQYRLRQAMTAPTDYCPSFFG